MKTIPWTAGLLACGIAGVSLAEEVSSADLFQQLDKNQDGQLVAEEIPESQMRFFERVVRIGDANEDGRITSSEFAAALNPAPEASPQGNGERRRPGGPRGERPDPEELFRRLDRNGDGQLNRDELPERAQERMAPIFDKLGTNSISLDQFQKIGRRGRPESAGDRPNRNGPPKDGERMRPDGDGPRDAMGRPPFQRRPPAFLVALDEDGNGTLSQKELANAASLFNQLDHNQDGELDMPELMGFAGAERDGDRNRPGMPSEGRPDGFRGFSGPGAGDGGPGGRGPGDRGPGGPGRGNFDPGQFFQRLDKDGDGTISKEEAPERMQQGFSRLDENGDGKVSQEEFRSRIQGGRPGNGGPRPNGPAPKQN